VVWVEESIERQKKALLGNQAIRIASTVWIAEQFLIPNLKNLKDKLDQPTNFDFSTPDKKYETHLLEGACDYVIVCHPPDDPAIAHRQLFKEEWIVVVPPSWKEENKRLTFEDLLKKPFIRHAQVNPDTFGLNSSELTHMNSLIVDNLIAVRSGVSKGHGWSVVPRILVNTHIKERKIAHVSHLIEMDRKLCLWWPRASSGPKKKAVMISSWLIENFEKL
jgi:DNA-binding transcriptional LysR family regulator